MPRTARMAFRARFESIPTARRFAVCTTKTWGYEAMGEDVALLVTELVTNVVCHTDADGTLELTDMTDGVHVEVHDSSTGEPTVGRGRPDAESGRGLHIVEQLASAWGVIPSRDGKVVWFELVGAPG